MFLAHLKWFEDSNTVVTKIITRNELFIVLLAVGAGLLALYFINRLLTPVNQKISRSLKQLRPFIPTVIRMTFGLSLMVFSIQGHWLAPNMHLEIFGGLSTSWRFFEFAIGVAFVAGFLLRYASVGLVVLMFLAVFGVGWVSAFEHLEYLGAAGFLLLAGPGRLALDNKFLHTKKTPEQNKKQALLFLQIFTGFSLVFLAFTEKLFNIALAEKFLVTFHWNFLSTAGLNNHWFIIFIGVNELVFGLGLMLNLAPRLITLLLAGAMGLTAALLGPTEVIGHLFGLGLVFAVWVGYDSLPNKAKQNTTN